jgi:PAS domain S-box-containing protein
MKVLSSSYMSHEHHEHLIKELTDQLEPILSNSPQAIYIYLDDTHKICNQKFSDLLGYTSVEEWVGNETALDDFVEEDQQKIVDAYINASESFKASTLSVSVRTKSGEQIPITVIMTPCTYKDEVFVLHFIDKV